MAITVRQIDWQSIRDAYVKSPSRPTYAELAEQFSISQSTISSASSDEGWPILRAQYLDSQLTSSGAKEIILSAIGASKAVTDRGATFGLMALECLTTCLSDPKLLVLAPSTRSDIVQTCSFAFANIAKGLRELGVVGISKTLNEGKEANGQWNPQMLSQINLTVQNLVGQVKEQTVTAKVEPTETPGEKP